MDLTDILQKRTDTDLRVAMARTLQISLEIEAAAAELKELRAQLRTLEAKAIKPQAEVPAVPLRKTGSAPMPAGAGPSASAAASPKLVSLFGRLLGRKPAAAPIQWHLDEIGGVFPYRDKDGVSAVVSGTGLPSLTLSGWVVPASGLSSFASVGVALIGRTVTVSREVSSHLRPDVAEHFGKPEFASSGFRFDIPMFDIPAGTYALEITARTSDSHDMRAHAGRIEVSE